LSGGEKNTRKKKTLFLSFFFLFSLYTKRSFDLSFHTLASFRHASSSFVAMNIHDDGPTKVARAHPVVPGTNDELPSNAFDDATMFLQKPLGTGRCSSCTVRVLIGIMYLGLLAMRTMQFAIYLHCSFDPQSFFTRRWWMTQAIVASALELILAMLTLMACYRSHLVSGCGRASDSRVNAVLMSLLKYVLLMVSLAAISYAYLVRLDMSPPHETDRLYLNEFEAAKFPLILAAVINLAHLPWIYGVFLRGVERDNHVFKGQ
jgi:hypothetical protein